MGNLSRRVVLSLPFVGALLARTAVRAQPASSAPDTDWTHYAGNAASTRYAPLDQINARNFNDLEVAWRFKPDMLGPRPEYQYEATPLVVKGRLYNVAGSRRDVVCLDAATGEMLWMHSQDEGDRGRNAPRQYSGHGVSYWTDGSEERIIYVTPGYQMIALDARTGIPVKSFGDNGVVDLSEGLVWQINKMHYTETSPPVVYKDLVKTRLVGDLQTELVEDFFGGFVNHAAANLHAKVLYGRSSHHKIEAIFKCFARALRYACSRDQQLKDQLPSTKGLL